MATVKFVCEKCGTVYGKDYGICTLGDRDRPGVQCGGLLQRREGK